MATVALIEGGDAAQRERWLPRIADGSALVTVAFGEDDSQWDPAHYTTRANGGKLTGHKPFVPYAAVADAIIVAAIDDAGPGLWLVERGAPGMEITAAQGRRHDAPRRQRALHRHAGHQARRQRRGACSARSTPAAC